MPKQEAKNKKRKIILIGLGALTAGALSYFGWQWWRKRMAMKEEEESSSASFSSMTEPPKPSAFLPTTNTIQRNDDFPLKKGSKGQRVKLMQEVLIAKYGKSILPKYGADGDFGSETAAALKKVNIPQEIDESTFNVLVKSGSVDAAKVADILYKAALSKNFQQVLFTLQGMKTKDDYTAINTAFLNYRLGGVRKTLVNGLLDSFADEKQKQQIRLEFTRMGLKYDGSKWSLSGIDGFSLITTEPAVVWKTPKTGIRVPANTVLGTEIAQNGKFTIFENNGHRFLVKASSVKHL